MLVFVLSVGLIFFLVVVAFWGCLVGGGLNGVCPWYKFWYNDFFFIITNHRMLIGRWSFYRDHREFPGNKAIPART